MKPQKQKQSFSEAELVRLIVRVIGQVKLDPNFGQNLSEEELAFGLAGKASPETTVEKNQNENQ